MSAWGPDAFDNDLALGLLQQLLDAVVYPALADGAHGRASQGIHGKAYYYDRCRAAIDLLIEIHEHHSGAIPSGYFRLAEERLWQISDDDEWANEWSGPSGKKAANYRRSIAEQCARIRRACPPGEKTK